LGNIAQWKTLRNENSAAPPADNAGLRGELEAARAVSHLDTARTARKGNWQAAHGRRVPVSSLLHRGPDR
jgi:hypothetical protein